MLSSKRAKIHQQIRKADWNRIFTMKRKSLLQGSNWVINELYKQVRRNDHEKQDYDLISRLLQCAQLNPQDQNAYIIIGNYLLDHNHSYPHFFHLIVDQPQILQNHSWCLFQLANIIFEQYSNANQQQSYHQENKLFEVLMCSTKVCQFLNENCQKPNFFNLKCIIYAYFQQIFKLALECSISTLIDGNTINVFCKILNFYGNQQTCQQNLKQILKIIYCICDRWDIFTLQSSQDLFIKQNYNIIMMGLKKMPFQREKIIKCLRKMLLNNTSSFIKIYYNDKFLTEIIYIFDEILSLKPSILKFLMDLMTQTELHQLMMLLNLRCHVHITHCLEWAMENHDNQCLQNGLLFIYNLLNRLNELNQERLVQRILKDISQQNFDLMIEGLITNQQNDGITNVVNNIIDDFYSQQIM